jgi:hypothetical protein
MNAFAASLVLVALALFGLPTIAAAQCEGGVTVAGQYLPNGTYVPGGCAYTNPTTPGQLYPSGAQPAPSTNPALAGSRLPGQQQPSDLIPVNSSDLGPAPSLVNSSTPAVLSPGSVVGATGPVPVLPAELPPSGAPPLTGNRAVPSSLIAPGANGGGPTDAASLSTLLDGVVPSLTNTAYGYSLPAAPPPPAAEPGEPPAPGRGGPSYLGEDTSSDIVITPPDR